VPPFLVTTRFIARTRCGQKTDLWASGVLRLSSVAHETAQLLALFLFPGGGLEASGRGRRFFRYDFGDTMLNLGSRRDGTRAGLSHSLTISLSLGLRY
jgi:hypothetical protein